jgi:transcriptional regulator with XRE-family HTH domain
MGRAKQKNLRDDEFLKEFGVYLREFREELGLTQKQVADKMNVEVMQISRIERGIVNTSISMIKKIAECYDVPIYDLFQKYSDG